MEGYSVFMILTESSIEPLSTTMMCGRKDWPMIESRHWRNSSAPFQLGIVTVTFGLCCSLECVDVCILFIYTIVS